MGNNLRLLLATSNCIAICEPSGDSWRVVRRDLMGNYTTSVIAHGERVLVGTRNGIYRSDDSCDSWRAVNNGLTVQHVRWLASHPEKPERVFAGTEPAGIFLSLDGGNSWRGCPEVVELREGQGWYLPYSPEAGCVRGFAFAGKRVYAAVEVGGMLVSDDSGDTWDMSKAPASPGGKIHPDVHSVGAFPGSAGMVASPTGGGFFFSEDGGENWENRYPGSYCRAFWWDENDVDHMLLGSADWVDRNGRIEETRDRALTWKPASTGVDLPWRAHMVERFSRLGKDLLAVLSNGETWISPLDSISWRRILPEVLDVKAASTLWMND